MTRLISQITAPYAHCRISRRIVTGFAVLVTASTGLTACGGSLPSLETSALEAGAPQASTVNKQRTSNNRQPKPVLSGLTIDAAFPGRPTTVYTRIAKAAHKCWLAPNRPLQPTHQFHANVAPARKGGEATIVIFQRGPKANPKHRLAAMRILITNNTIGSSKVEIINRRFPAPVASQMIAAIQNWAGGKSDCPNAGLFKLVTSTVPLPK